MTIKRDKKAVEFEGLRIFIRRMFDASGDIGKVAERIEKQLPILANTIGKENDDIKALTEALEKLKLHNSEATILVASLLEDNEDLKEVKHEMRQLATISQLPPILAQTSPEFLRDVLTTAEPQVIKNALSIIDGKVFEKLLKALNSD